MEVKEQLTELGFSNGLIIAIVFIALIFYVITSIYSLRNLVLSNKLMKLELKAAQDPG